MKDKFDDDLVFYDKRPEGFDLTEEKARAAEASRSGIVLREADDDALDVGDDDGACADDDECGDDAPRSASDGEDF